MAAPILQWDGDIQISGQYLRVGGVVGGFAVALTDVTGLSAALAAKSDVGHTHDFLALTNRPTTVAGYGLTDALSQAAGDARYLPLTYTPAWATISGKPTTFAPAAHSHPITDIQASGAPNASNYLRGDGVWAPVSGGAGSGGITLADADGRYLQLGGGNITGPLTVGGNAVLTAGASVPWTALTGRPTTIAGYGITDALSTTSGDARYRPIAYVPAWSEITSRPTTVAGYGITDALSTTSGDARYLQLAGGTLTGAVDAAYQTVDRIALKRFRETRATPAGGTGTLALDLATASVFETTLTANATAVTISNAVASGNAQTFTVLLTLGSTVYGVTWPASVKWSGGSAPTLTANKTQTITFLSTDGGTTWRAFDGGAS